MRSLKILLIEDDTIEVMKFNRVVDSLSLRHEVQISQNAEEALKYLNENDTLPDLILLDLNMPKINGLEFLKLLKNDARLRYMPTVILTTSNNQRDLKQCYKLGIGGYLLKPLKYEDYISKIEKLLAYWSINELIKV
ncbi:response regulator [Winogradskyella aurantiaca]|uniref:response regulator n=1 Tax=Winogradskyella aurantiaca TaxID=2219558 RepID=UPI000E1C83B9|nr:response regulator [Winogradskyella aurantiaca]